MVLCPLDAGYIIIKVYMLFLAFLQAKSEKKLKQLQKTLADLEVSTDKERREREIAVDEKDTLLTSLHAEQTRCVSLKEQAESLQV